MGFVLSGYLITHVSDISSCTHYLNKTVICVKLFLQVDLAFLLIIVIA